MFCVLKTIEDKRACYESTVRKFGRGALQTSDAQLRNIVQLVSEWVGFLSSVIYDPCRTHVITTASANYHGSECVGRYT